MLGAYYMLIPQYEILGAAWATVLGFACFAVVNIVVAHRVFPVRMELRRTVILFAMAIGLYYASTPLKLGILPFGVHQRDQSNSPTQ